MNTALLVLAIVLLLAVLGAIFAVYGSINRLLRFLGAEKQPPAHLRRADEADVGSEAELEVDPGGSGVGAEFALGAAATPSAASGVSYDLPETGYPDSGATGWSYQETAPSPATGAGALPDDSGVTTGTEPSWEPSGSGAGVEETAPAEELARPEPAIEAGVTQRPMDDEPEEQPFERDGRWWFKRGHELLVYDEQTGQWEPAPSPTVQALATNPTSAQAGAITAEFAGLRDDAPTSRSQTKSDAEAAPVTATEDTNDTDDEEEVPETPTPAVEGEPQPVREWESGSFWKCPSCGAVNGSTATSCRMCFAARA